VVVPRFVVIAFVVIAPGHGVGSGSTGRPSGGLLAGTGIDIVSPLVGGAAALALGAELLIASRRRGDRAAASG
jgi:hypothetical protein